MSKIEVPETKAEELEYRCLICGFRGTYDQRDEHRITHKGEKKR